MDLDSIKIIYNLRNCLPQGFEIVSSIGSSGEVSEIEMNLIPAFIQLHGNSANEGFDSSIRLIIRGSETSAYIFIIDNLNFECEIFFQLEN